MPIFFLIWACKALGIEDVQVMDFGGITDLTSYLKTVVLLPNFETVSTIVIARDAETDPLTATINIKNSLKQVSLPIPETPFVFCEGVIKTAFIIFPGFEGQDLLPGTLENLCLEIAKDASIFKCVDAYIQCLQSNDQEIKRPHKIRLHSYLSGNNDYVGLKIGEAAKAGAWNWNHEKFTQFKNLIKSM